MYKGIRRGTLLVVTNEQRIEKRIFLFKEEE
jgi:hypothetical protein